jgi:hypothetical protein
MATSSTKDGDAPIERSERARATAETVSEAPVRRPEPVPRQLTLTEREALRSRLQKKFH